MNIHQTIIRPIITEKSMKDTEKHIFSFIVAVHATKKEIQEAVEKLFSVHVMNVATSIHKGGVLRTGAKRVEVSRQPMKKAFVTLQKGEKISAFEAAQ